MNPDITWEDVRPLLPQPVPPEGEALVAAYVDAMAALLRLRYPAATVDQWEAARPLVLVYVAAAVSRRLAKTNEMATSEQSGPFSVRWAASSTEGGLFLGNELADLDKAFGKGGTRSYRTPAPDEQRYLNRLKRSDVVRNGSDVESWC